VPSDGWHGRCIHRSDMCHCKLCTNERMFLRILAMLFVV
jgi:hypothetical protein